MNKNEIQKALDELVEKGLAESFYEDGEKKYRITQAGEDAIVQEKPKRGLLSTIWNHWSFWLIMSAVNFYFVLYNFKHDNVGLVIYHAIAVIASLACFAFTLNEKK